MSKGNGKITAEDIDDGLTPKMEKFIEQYLETGNASEAYRRAYDAENMKPETIHVKACELLKHGKVSERLRVVRVKAAQRSVLTAQTILDELEQARLLALSLEQPGAMIAASMGRAKVSGLIVEKKEVGGPGEFTKMTDEELHEQAAQLAAQLGLAQASKPN